MSKRSIILHGHATSVSVEDAFWAHLKRIAKARNLSMQALIEAEDEAGPLNLSSALRLLVLKDLEQQLEATDRAR